MRYEELKKLSEQDLHKEHAQACARLQTLRFKLGANQVKDVRELRALRKTIAHIQTLQKANSTV